jgi:hypothetical protein
MGTVTIFRRDGLVEQELSLHPTGKGGLMMHATTVLFSPS